MVKIKNIHEWNGSPQNESAVLLPVIMWQPTNIQQTDFLG